MDRRVARQASPLYLLERFDVGLVHLDAERRVVGMNDFARRVLPVDQKQPFDRMVLSFHPERSQPKVEFLLDQASQCPVANPPPMTMINNIPERMLLIKVSHLSGAAAAPTGDVLVFYDITDFVSAGEATAAPSGAQRRLLKTPTVAHQKSFSSMPLRLDGHEGSIPVSRSSAAAVLKRLGPLAGTTLTSPQG